MSNALERYLELNLKESLEKTLRYPFACEELSLILRLAYNRVSKNLQSLIFRDTLRAFRLLPNMQTSSAVSAAHLLLKSAEAALPKQKRNSALAEFKHAKVTQKRRCKVHKEETGSTQLSQDVLAHIFSFLDMQSLVSAMLVCWAWNLAASDKHLWRLQYSIFFGDSDDDSKSKYLQGGTPIKEGYSEEDTGPQTCVDWREAFKKAYAVSSSKRLSFRRGYCDYCNMVVWHYNLKCPKEFCRLKFENELIRLISPLQVVDYILDDSSSVISPSDSDSESDEGSGLRLWAYPRHFSS